MFAKNGPTFLELMQQALTSTPRGYDLLAPKFDATPFRTPEDVLAPSVVAIGKVESALDVCCGTGAAMEFLRPFCSRRLVGIDFSEGMLEQAKQKLRLLDDPPITEFVEADVMEMEYKEEFDVVTCFGALGHILPEDQHTFIRLIHRALKPGGRFVFVTAAHPPLLSPVSIILHAFNFIMKIRNALIKPPFIMYYLTFLLPEAGEMLEEAGFSVEIREKLFPTPFQKYRLVLATKK